jgi:hypothetical protein
MAEGAIHVHLRAVAPDLAPLCRITFALAPLPPHSPRSGPPASPQRPALDLPNGRQPWWNVLKQLTRPASYFSDVLRGRDAAVGQFGILHDTAFIGSPSLARDLLGSEDRSGLNIGWGPALGARAAPAPAARPAAWPVAPRRCRAACTVRLHGHTARHAHTDMRAAGASAMQGSCATHPRVSNWSPPPPSQSSSWAAAACRWCQTLRSTPASAR